MPELPPKLPPRRTQVSPAAQCVEYCGGKLPLHVSPSPTMLLRVERGRAVAASGQVGQHWPVEWMGSAPSGHSGKLQSTDMVAISPEKHV